jgi:L-ascorbate metabolism protein UlaG (beta-lactamase superfamily)
VIAGGFVMRWLTFVPILSFLAGPALAEDKDPCLAPLAFRTPLIQKAAVVLPEPGIGQVAITFIGHSTFLIESPGRVKIATDYNDYVMPPVVPDIATMNKAHSTHYSRAPDPAIKQVLRGWGDGRGPARYDVTLGDVRVRNIPTNIRDMGGATDRDGNSIFVFEIAGVCIAHLGHLHHTLNAGQLKQLGHIDIVLAPVDGSWTLDIDGMAEVLETIGAKIVIPMHMFGPQTLERFLRRVGERYPVERSDSPSLLISRDTLPDKPKVVVLPGRHF